MYFNQTVTIFGGTGFIGRYLVKEIAKTGAKINVISRNPNHASFLKVAGNVGQITIVKGVYDNQKWLDNIAQNSDVIINTIGVLVSKRGASFKKIHITLPDMISKACETGNVKKFIHVSALGVDKNFHSKYAMSKREGEKLIKNNFANSYIIRPSIVFGIEDDFFNKFAKMAKYSPILPLIFNGKTRFQPVYVADIGKAIAKIVTHDNYSTGTYELGGPDIITFKQMIDFVLENLEIKRKYFNIPFPYLFARICSILPKPPITLDQVKMLESDNVTQDKAKTFFDLNIQPHKIEEIVPHYLEKYKRLCYYMPTESASN